MKETLGELLPVHREAVGVAAAQRQKGVRAAEGLQVPPTYAARDGFYLDRAAQDADLAAQVKTVHEESKGRYGSPRVHAQLRAQGKAHSRKRVARLMRQAGLQGRAAKRWKKTTIPDPAAAARADKIRRDFTADASKVNTRRVRDITLHRHLGRLRLYLAAVLDIASRRVAGYALADHLRTELIADALSNAVAARDPEPGVVFHSDRGCQYTSAAFASLAEDNQVTLSAGRTGQCWDNALAESFFSLASRLVLTDTAAHPPGPGGTKRAVVEYIAW